MKPVVEIQQPVQRIKSTPLAPPGNPFSVVNAGLSRNPAGNLLVARTRRDELFEFSGVNPGDLLFREIQQQLLQLEQSGGSRQTFAATCGEAG